ncbi:hypothetical protein SAMN05421812_13217 [Asanoa hainanensis]|uniref:Uncharacterized protein n=1 Tax=Asanoa hainanensis TaxID=560556 RepID=A0A239PIC3_9ACTN|nr:hypothetical protein SAMN05421812_13217 [Asanoa hainanensis]
MCGGSAPIPGSCPGKCRVGGRPWARRLPGPRYERRRRARNLNVRRRHPRPNACPFRRRPGGGGESKAFARGTVGVGVGVKKRPESYNQSVGSELGRPADQNAEAKWQGERPARRTADPTRPSPYQSPVGHTKRWAVDSPRLGPTGADPAGRGKCRASVQCPRILFGPWSALSSWRLPLMASQVSMTMTGGTTRSRAGLLRPLVLLAGSWLMSLAALGRSRGRSSAGLSRFSRSMPRPP